MSTVLVTDARRGVAVAFIRSLDRAGHDVIAADVDRVSAGRWSRRATASLTYPDPFIDPEGAAAALRSHIATHDVDVVVPITDAVISVVRSIEADLPPGCIVGAAEPDALAMVADKERTIRLATELGVPVPRTINVGTVEQAVIDAAELGWPVVIKPGSSLGVDEHGAMHHFEVDYGFDEVDLAAKLAAMPSGTPVLLQEMCAGAGVGIEVLASDGEILAIFSHRRLHEVPVTGGASALRVAEPLDPTLVRYTEQLVSSLGWTGLAMVEFKGSTGGHRLMEINGRPWGSLPLAVRAGVDFPADYVTMLTDGPESLRSRLRTYDVGTTARNLELEMIWIGSVVRGRRAEGLPFPRRRDAIGAVLRLASPSIGYDILSWRDPMPGVAEIMRIVGRLAGKARRG